LGGCSAHHILRQIFWLARDYILWGNESSV
jgi:hypothetical protein